ncbi:acetyltransferase [Cesiribacter andamanensis]|uniref:Putative N-acetyltransferase YjaB n=1 Tax=Cesiribacter andamanensis AMV16 TaxID=1279009 RepID=M7N416_9BACT|nr:acetyltransferase [Cesiribacter andamanensis]EMR02032.1 putative N-acetyltransferase YjaB [Cesiribacter andamanensis AMV16]
METFLSIVPLTPTDFPELVEIWEASVRATHHFLSEADIQYFKPLILQEFLYQVQLAGIRDGAGRILGFVGVAEGKVEMLFLHPAARGQGIGKRLLRHAITDMGATTVDVNEQNEQAVGFYLHEGFGVIGRSERDGLGKPYPLLHLQLLPAEQAQ